MERISAVNQLNLCHNYFCSIDGYARKQMALGMKLDRLHEFKSRPLHHYFSSIDGYDRIQMAPGMKLVQFHELRKSVTHISINDALSHSHVV
ncbi:MAG: hypothetical protein ACXADC_01225 [Candidatus Thorarchaeota archaeon]|jgi:hypothetical protein